MARVLFVCLGNICRSPLAEGIFRSQVAAAGLSDQIQVDSAGTGAWHIGQPADPRSVQTARTHGIDLTGRARQVQAGDFYDFDLILAMDSTNLSDLQRLAPADSTAQIQRFTDADVPDPYYGGDDGFEEVYQMLYRGGELLLRRWMQSPQ